MADDADRTSGAADDEARKRALRPNPTLDLDATEVSSSAPQGPPDAGGHGPSLPDTEPAVATPEHRVARSEPPSQVAGHVAAAIGGAILALAVLYGLDRAELLPRPPAAQDTATTQRVAGLSRDVAMLQKQLADVAQHAPPSQGPAVDKEARQDARQVGSGLADLKKTVDGLQQRVGDLATAAGKDSGANERALLQRVGQLAGTLGDMAKQFQASLAGKASSDELARLGRQVDEQRSAAADAAKQVQSALAGKASDADLHKLARQVDGQQQALAKSGAANAAQTAAEARASSALASVAALEGAVARGTPYADLLDGVGKLLAGQDLKPLAAYAEHGAPTLASLRAHLAADVSAANPSPPANAGFLTRIMASARSLVRITPAEPSAPIKGDSAAARRARVIAALDRGDDAAALKSWDMLDDSVKSASRSAADALRRRLAVGQTLDALRHAAVGALGKTEAAAPASNAPAPAEQPESAQ